MLISPSSSSKTNVRTTSGLRTMQNLPKVPGGRRTVQEGGCWWITRPGVTIDEETPKQHEHRTTVYTEQVLPATPTELSDVSQEWGNAPGSFPIRNLLEILGAMNTNGFKQALNHSFLLAVRTRQVSMLQTRSAWVSRLSRARLNCPKFDISFWIFMAPEPLWAALKTRRCNGSPFLSFFFFFVSLLHSS